METRSMRASTLFFLAQSTLLQSISRGNVRRGWRAMVAFLMRAMMASRKRAVRVLSTAQGESEVAQHDRCDDPLTYFRDGRSGATPIDSRKQYWSRMVDDPGRLYPTGVCEIASSDSPFGQIQ